MKFVYFGYDFMLPSIHRLMAEGHELIGIFSFTCDNVFNFNRDCQELALRLQMPVIFSKPEDFHIDAFIARGAECFLSAGYPHKIPPIDESQAYGVNIHPTALPQGRGLMPIPHIIMNNTKIAAGLTAHKMTQEFDEGDILLQAKFDLAPDETVETYSAKVALRAPGMAAKLMREMPYLWKHAKAQSAKKASMSKPPSDDDRLLDWTKSVAEIDCTARAFGRFGSLARFDDGLWVVYDHDAWIEKHGLAPGAIAARLSREILIAAKDGFVLLKDYQPAKMD